VRAGGGHLDEHCYCVSCAALFGWGLAHMVAGISLR